MISRRRMLSLGLPLGLGWAVGAWITPTVPPRLQAQVVDGARDTIPVGLRETTMITAPVSMHYNPALKTVMEQDGVYVLDYQGGRLLAAVPSLRKMPGQSRLLDRFAERDLVRDFAIPPGSASHFVMTTGKIGELWAPVFVLETHTRRLAAYQVIPQMVGGISRPRIDLLEVRDLQPSAPPPGAG